MININNIIRNILFDNGWIEESGESRVNWIASTFDGKHWCYKIYDIRKEEEIDDLALKEYKEIEYAMGKK